MIYVHAYMYAWCVHGKMCICTYLYIFKIYIGMYLSMHLFIHKLF